jgi:hypothetical protein
MIGGTRNRNAVGTKRVNEKMTVRPMPIANIVKRIRPVVLKKMYSKRQVQSKIVVKNPTKYAKERMMLVA